MRQKLKIIFIVLCLVIVFVGCKKQKDNLFSISISANNMVGTPAEAFSLQQIKMFQASNEFVFKLLRTTNFDSIQQNVSFSPFYLMNNILIDTNNKAYSEMYCKKYNLHFANIQQILSCLNSFEQTVEKIDSCIKIKSYIDQKDNQNIISQSFDIKLLYNNSAPEDIDNIFTTFDNKKPRIDFITITDNVNLSISQEEQVCDIPISNGNYTMMLIKPTNQTVFEYIKDFDEKKYLSIINSMELRKVKVSFPLGKIITSNFQLTLPPIQINDTMVSLNGTLLVNSEINLFQAPKNEIAENLLSQLSNTVLETNDSKPIKYNSPYIFIIRGKSSNLILYIGICVSA